MIITKHAIAAYGRRRADPRMDILQEADWNMDSPEVQGAYLSLEEEIRLCVTSGLNEGLVFTKRPPGFLLYGRKNSDLPPEQRFVQCDKDANYGFILKRTRKEGDIVVTTITKAGVA